ncbi:MAG: type II toxin-antitoxin system VapB family antitoxin [Pseudonocardia sp.]
MPDILIRDVPADVLAAVDANAERLGLSRSEFLRRQIAQVAARRPQRCTVEDLRRTAEVFADLDDPEIMRKAWE